MKFTKIRAGEYNADGTEHVYAIKRVDSGTWTVRVWRAQTVSGMKIASGAPIAGDDFFTLADGKAYVIAYENNTDSVTRHYLNRDTRATLSVYGQ